MCYNLNALMRYWEEMEAEKRYFKNYNNLRSKSIILYPNSNNLDYILEGNLAILQTFRYHVHHNRHR